MQEPIRKAAGLFSLPGCMSLFQPEMIPAGCRCPGRVTFTQGYFLVDELQLLVSGLWNLEKCWSPLPLMVYLDDSMGKRHQTIEAISKKGARSVKVRSFGSMLCGRRPICKCDSCRHKWTGKHHPQESRRAGRLI